MKLAAVITIAALLSSASGRRVARQDVNPAATILNQFEALRTQLTAITQVLSTLNEQFSTAVQTGIRYTVRLQQQVTTKSLPDRSLVCKPKVKGRQKHQARPRPVCQVASAPICRLRHQCHLHQVCPRTRRRPVCQTNRTRHSPECQAPTTRRTSPSPACPASPRCPAFLVKTALAAVLLVLISEALS